MSFYKAGLDGWLRLTQTGRGLMWSYKPGWEVVLLSTRLGLLQAGLGLMLLTRCSLITIRL